VDDQSQKDDMRNAVLGDRKRALERWREEGRAPVFGPLAERAPEPEPAVVPQPEPEPAVVREPEPAVVSPPEPELEPEVGPPEPDPTPVDVARAGWLRRLFRR
jgi:hypothetical protein